MAFLAGSFVITFNDITIRKKTEDALRESEDKFRHLFEYSTVGKSVTLPTGEINLNRAFCEMLGYAPGEIDQSCWRRITHPDDVERSAQEIAEILSGGKSSARFEKRYLRRDGTVVWGELSSTPRRDASGKIQYLMTSVIDITDRKRAEVEMQRMNALLDSVIESIPHMLFLKNATDLTFARVNRAGEAMLGIAKSELLGKTDFDLFPREQAARYVATDRYVLSGIRTVDIAEESVQTRNYGEVFVRTIKVPILGSNGVPEYLLVLCEDITERKRSEQARSETLDELRRWHQVTLGRETRILELKREVNLLLAKHGEAVRYSVDKDKEG